MTEQIAQGNNAAAQIKAYIERVELLEEERKERATDIRDIYAEAKGNGFDAKTLRRIVALRRKDADKVKEENAMLETYLHAIGMEFLA